MIAVRAKVTAAAVPKRWMRFPQMASFLPRARSLPHTTYSLSMRFSCAVCINHQNLDLQSSSVVLNCPIVFSKVSFARDAAGRVLKLLTRTRRRSAIASERASGPFDTLKGAALSPLIPSTVVRQAGTPY